MKNFVFQQKYLWTMQSNLNISPKVPDLELNQKMESNQEIELSFLNEEIKQKLRNEIGIAKP